MTDPEARPPPLAAHGSVRAQCIAPQHLGDGRAEARKVAPGLEAHQVIGEQVAHQRLVAGQRAQRLDVRERDVQEEAEGARHGRAARRTSSWSAFSAAAGSSSGPSWTAYRTPWKQPARRNGPAEIGPGSRPAGVHVKGGSG